MDLLDYSEFGIRPMIIVLLQADHSVIEESITLPDMTPLEDHYEANATYVLIIIILVFILCETPELIHKIITVITRHVKSMDEFFSREFRSCFSTLSELLMVCNSSLNFFVYLAFGRRFRRVMKMTFSPHVSTGTHESVPLNVLR